MVFTAAADGEPVVDSIIKERIANLVIPPAWQQVWITAEHPTAHLGGLGTDVAGRRQYPYHADWLSRRHEKFDRVLGFMARLPKARTSVDDDLARPGMPRNGSRLPVSAPRPRHFRIGGESYALANGSYGWPRSDASMFTGRRAAGLEYVAKHTASVERIR